MAATDKTLRDQRILDIVFAVSNTLMLLSIIWMLWDDYAREYKADQRAFRDVETAMAQHTALAQIPSADEFKEKEKAVKEARKEREKKENVDALAEASARVRSLQPQREIADAGFQAAKAEVDSKNSFLEIALEAGDKETVQKLRETLVGLNATLAEKQAARDSIVNQMKEEQLKIDKIEDPVTKAAGEFKKINDKLDAQVKLALSKTWGLDDRFRSLWLIDGFASPLKIHQFTINDIPLDYNFKYVTRFDRCMTCHLGIDRPAYTRENLLALKTDVSQADLDKAKEMYKTRTELVEPKDAAAIPNPNKMHLIKLGDNTLSPARIKEFTAHPRLDLFVGSGSKHPAEKFGCSSCHYGQGSGTSFLDSSHTPDSGDTREEWAKNKHWAPSHDWDFPMLPHRFVESSCLKCHHEVTDLISSDNRVEAPKVVRGFNLIKDNGCFGCHEINGWKSGNRVGPDLRLEPNPPLDALTPLERDRAIKDPDNRPGTLRKVGPALSRVSEKVKDGWIEKWLYSPSTFRPDTKMPHYFNLSTNDPKALKEFDKTNAFDKDGKANPNFLKQENFPNTEIASIAHFLTVTSKNYLAGIAKHQNDDAAAKAADENRLLELINKGRLEVDDQKELNALKQRIKFRREMKPVKDDAVPKGKAEIGRKLFIERGCLSCHTHQGTEPDVTSAAVFGPNLSQLPAKIGTSDSSHQWLTRWILDPKAYSPRTRMPQTHLTPEEAADVAAWLLNQPPADLGAGWKDVKIEPPSMNELRNLATVYLTRMLSKSDIELFFKGKKGDKEDLAATVMLNDVTDDEKTLFKNVADENAMKYYLGKKAVNRLGCFGCHDIPGFENAKSIGTGLNDWGKKPADRLAFEDIGNFFQNHYYSTYKDSKGGEKNVDATFEDNGKLLGAKEIGGERKEPYEKFYADALLGHHPERMGYLNQKIRDPRSYDYNRVRTWDDRARMPKFSFSRPRRHKDESDADFQARIFKEEAEAREAVASFILGLTAEMVPAKMTNQPTGDRLHEVKGRQVIDQFNCAGCHLIRPGVYEFKPSATAMERLGAAFKAQAAPMKEQGEIVFQNHINWVGRNPLGGDRLTAYGVQPHLEKDLFNDDVPAGDQKGYTYLTIRLSEALRFNGANKAVDNIPASAPIFIPLADLTDNPSALQSQADFDREFGASAPLGGTFANLLVPYLIRKDPKKYLKTPDGDSSEARASLPPILIGQGERTQPDWLYDFLLNPQKVRRMAILQMPKFNMSKDEAKLLVDYFAGVTRQINPGIGLPYPYQDIAQHEDLDGPYWRKKNADYVARLKQGKAKDAAGKPLMGDNGKPLSAYEQRIAAYTPVWEQLRKEQEKSLQEKIKRAEGALTATAKAKTDAEKAVAGAKGAEKKKLDEEIEAFGQTAKTIAADKQQLEKSLAELDVKTLRKNWEEKEAYAADGYRMLTSRKLCLQCHPIGEFSASEPNKQGPPLALASQRLRPGFIERWVDKPQRFVPYASLMPPYFDKNKEQYQQLHAGPALDQIDTLRDVLLNFPRVSNLPINRIYDPDQPAAK